MSNLITQIRTYISSRPELQKIVSNTGWLFSDRVVRMVVGVFVGAWLARYLGAQTYGQLNIAQAYIVLVTPVVKLGLDQVVVQRLVDNLEDKDEILGTAMGLRLLVASITLPILLFIIYQVGTYSNIVNILVVLLSVGVLVQSVEVVDFFFQAQVASRNVVIARNVAFGLTSLFKVVAIILNASVFVIGVVLSLDIVLFAVGLLIAYRRYGGQLRAWRFRWSRAVDLLRTSWPLLFAGLAVSTYMRVDQLMLSYMIPGEAGENAVGVYAAAVRIAEMWYFIPVAIVSSVFPAVLQTRKGSYSLYVKRLQRLFNLLVLISYGFSLFVMVFSGPIIRVLFGPEYAEAVMLLNVLVWSGVWVSLGVARSAVFHAEQREVLSLWASGLGAVTNITLNFALIPILGAMGCAIATFIGYSVSAYLSSFLLPIELNVGNMQSRAIIFPNPFNYRSS